MIKPTSKEMAGQAALTIRRAFISSHDGNVGQTEVTDIILRAIPLEELLEVARAASEECEMYPDAVRDELKAALSALKARGVEL